MRVISGRFKGVALATPRQGTRPTTDRTKEAIFSHLDAWGALVDARVLDLFAGTGALGLEALSRGAHDLLAVESSKPAAMLIGRTVTQLRRHRAWQPDMTARVVAGKAEQVAAAPVERAFDVIFIDPPYAFATADCNRLLRDLVEHGLADDASVIVLERSARSDDPTPPDGWHVARRRDYGETAVFYIESVSS